MGVIIRQSIKSSVAIYLGVLVGIVNRLILFPKYLTPEQLGLVDILLNIALFLSSFGSMGMIGTLVRYFDFYRNKNKSESFTGLTFLVATVGFIIIGMVFVLMKPAVLDYFPLNRGILDQFFYLILPLTYFYVLKGLFSNYAIINLSAAIPSLLNDFVIKVGISLLILLLGLQFIHFDQYMYLLVGVYGLVTFLLIAYCKVNFGIKMNFNFSSLRRDDHRQIGKYSLFMIFASFSNYISQLVDSVMLGSISGLDVAGIYSIAFFIGLSIEMPKRAISNISLPIILKNFNEGKHTEIDKLYKQSSINQGVIGSFLLMLVIINIDEIFFLLPRSEVYSVGKNVAIIIGLSRLVDMITGSNNEILRSSRHYYIDIYLFLFLFVVSLVSNYQLIPIYGINGAAIATLISMFLYNLARYLVLKKLYGLEPFTKRTLKLTVLLCGLLAINYLTRSWEATHFLAAVFMIVVKCIIYGGAFIILCYKLRISDEANQLLENLLHRIKNILSGNTSR